MERVGKLLRLDNIPISLICASTIFDNRRTRVRLISDPFSSSAAIADAKAVVKQDVLSGRFRVVADGLTLPQVGTAWLDADDDVITTRSASSTTVSTIKEASPTTGTMEATTRQGAGSGGSSEDFGDLNNTILIIAIVASCLCICCLFLFIVCGERKSAQDEDIQQPGLYQTSANPRRGSIVMAPNPYGLATDMPGMREEANFNNMSDMLMGYGEYNHIAGMLSSRGMKEGSINGGYLDVHDSVRARQEAGNHYYPATSSLLPQSSVMPLQPDFRVRGSAEPSHYHPPSDGFGAGTWGAGNRGGVSPGWAHEPPDEPHWPTIAQGQGAELGAF
jgi:hypothetical protein